MDHVGTKRKSQSKYLETTPIFICVVEKEEQKINQQSEEKKTQVAISGSQTEIVEYYETSSKWLLVGFNFPELKLT